MRPDASFRAIHAQIRRQERAAQTRQRELERQLKEQAKLSAAEQARLEVSAYDNQIDLLLSIHQECGKVWDWKAVASSLPPPIPSENHYVEFATRRRVLLQDPSLQGANNTSIEQARAEDQQTLQKTQEDYQKQLAEWEILKSLAQRIVAGEHKAYLQAIVDLSPLNELASLGSSIHFSVQDAKTLECTLKVDGTQAIPQEIKSLTSKDKLSVKPMPRNRFQEIYHDYVSGCVLRVAREIFALLPVNTLLITASADCLDAGTGLQVERPVLSVIIPRSSLDTFDFDQLDPSDTIETFQHRGKLKLTRKAGTFETIIPLTVADGPKHRSPPDELGFEELLEIVHQTRTELRNEYNALKKSAESLTSGPNLNL